MPAEPVREQILAAVAAKLATIAGTRPWGGSYPHALTVDRGYKDPLRLDETQFPYLCVVEGSGSTASIEATGGGTVRIRHQLKIELYGYVRGGAVARATWLQRLWDDVFKVLVANATLDGVARDIAPFDGPDLTDGGEIDPIGAFLQTITADADEDVAV